MSVTPIHEASSGQGFTKFRKILFCVTSVMYLATLVYWIAGLVTQFRTFNKMSRELSATYSLIPPSDCFWYPDEYILPYCTNFSVFQGPSILQAWDSAQDCVGTVTLTFNVCHTYLLLQHTRSYICDKGGPWRCYRMVESMGAME